jgi:ABC-2 type transport system ATP-binding protein
MIRTEKLEMYFGRVHALRGADLVVKEGSATALLGANGAGKSTLIRILMNLYQPSRGTATVLGVDSRRLTPHELRHIGYVAESQEMPERFTTTAYLNYLRPFYPSWDRDLELALLRRFDLPRYQNIGHLSHGMRMKLRLLCALAFHPTLLILDEPLSGLDPMSRDDLVESLLGNAEGVTILISSQEVNEIEGLATHVALLDGGQFVLQETTQTLTDRFREVRVTLDREAMPPLRIDPSWMQLQTSGNVLSFVEGDFSEDKFEQVKSRFHDARWVEVQPMGLRSIFSTLARTRHATTLARTRHAGGQL